MRVWLAAATVPGRLTAARRFASSLPPELAAKVQYNCILSAETLKLSWVQRRNMEADRERDRRKEVQRQIMQGVGASARPIALRFLTGEPSQSEEQTQESIEEDSAIPARFPFKLQSAMAKEAIAVEPRTSPEEESPPVGREWMKDYEYFSDKDEDDIQEGEVEENLRLSYGTPNRRVPVSRVPCGGCGAYLHCQDTAIPGYLPSELFAGRSVAQLRSLKCQRCHFLEHYRTALNVSVGADEYPRLLSSIRDKRALALLLLDVTDVPCSLWPGIVNDIIGTKRPVVIAGNKADLLPPDGPGFLNRAHKCLEQAVAESELARANVKHVCLVSARTGYGLEELITRLHNVWEYKGDVYILGCTNVGKSTLFNALLQSDYCKVQAADLLQRATTSPWPGTTLNLLKFPILRPEGWRLRDRVMRLRALRDQERAERMMRRLQLKQSRDPHLASLIGLLGRTYRDSGRQVEGMDPFSMRIALPAEPPPSLGIDPNARTFKLGRWCYDTPGTIHPDQVLGLLTAEELGSALPSAMLLPRTFFLRPGQTLLVGGLARIDFLEADRPGHVRWTVLAPESLPVTVCQTEHAEELYAPLAATGALSVPRGPPARLEQWPGLRPAGPPLELPPGLGAHQSCADVVLPSTGWVAVTASPGQQCRLQPFTPHGRGAHLRQPPLLPNAVALRGPRIRGSPAYFRGKAVRPDPKLSPG